MEVIETPIPGVLVLEPRIFGDSRGYFFESFSRREFVQKVMETAERILEICREPLPADSIIQRVFISYGLRMTIEQYVLIGSTVRSYLAWLKDSGQIDVIADNGMILWRKIC